MLPVSSSGRVYAVSTVFHTHRAGEQQHSSHTSNGLQSITSGAESTETCEGASVNTLTGKGRTG